MAQYGCSRYAPPSPPKSEDWDYGSTQPSDSEDGEATTDAAGVKEGPREASDEASSDGDFFDDESSDDDDPSRALARSENVFFGTYEVDGFEDDLVITPALISWKGANCFPRDAQIVGRSVVHFTTFVPKQPDRWEWGLVGHWETFALTFDASGDTFSGRYQKQDDAKTRQIFGSRKGRPRSAAALGSAAPRTRENDCPACARDWSPRDVTCVETACGHRFCLACVASTCRLTPPADKGVCPLCQEPVDPGLISLVRDNSPYFAGPRRPSHREILEPVLRNAPLHVPPPASTPLGDRPLSACLSPRASNSTPSQGTPLKAWR